MRTSSIWKGFWRKMHQFKTKEHDCVYIWVLHLIRKTPNGGQKPRQNEVLTAHGCVGVRYRPGEVMASIAGSKGAIFAFIWPDGGVNENRSALRSVGRWLSAAVRLPAIKYLARWRAFLSYSHTYRSNSDKWDVTALVKQGYNLSKYNIICDLTWQTHCLFPMSQLAWIHLQNITFPFIPDYFRDNQWCWFLW